MGVYHPYSVEKRGSFVALAPLKEVLQQYITILPPIARTLEMGPVAGMQSGSNPSLIAQTGRTQVAPAVDVTALAVDVLKQQDDKAQRDNSFPWTILNAFGSSIGTFLVATAALTATGIGFRQWLWNRKDEQKKRDEDRFQAAVARLGNDDKAAIGAAIMLRTFLQEGYEKYYRQVFDLAVGYLRLRPVDPEKAERPDPLSQALIGVFVESFPSAREYFKSILNLDETIPLNWQLEKYLSASFIQLDKALPKDRDLRDIWMPEAHLREANLRRIKLQGANLHTTDLRGADLTDATLDDAALAYTDFRGADLTGAYLRNTNFFEAKFGGANLKAADLSGSSLIGTNIEDAQSLEDTDLRGVTGLTKERLKACRDNGAIIDEDPTTSASLSASAPSLPSISNDAQAPSASSAQGSGPASDTDGGDSAASPQQVPES